MSGVFVPARCAGCGADCYVETEWQNGQRVPITSPLCDECKKQEVLF